MFAVDSSFTYPTTSSSSSSSNSSTGRADTPCSSESDQEMITNNIMQEPCLKEQQMYIWNDSFEKWHECSLKFSPPYLYVSEYEDTRLEMEDKQLKHHKERWFYGDISRREARCLLQDYDGGDGSFIVRTSESYNGKFAISFMHEGRIKHVVIETRPDPVTGVLYHITPHGPCFDSLYSLIEEAKKTCIIKNHIFDVILTKSPPKPDCRWLHKKVKSLSKAEKLMKKESKDGSFFVYKTTSEYAPYSLVYRHKGTIIHNPILSGQRSFTLQGTSAPVLYKLIHYYMENPINGDCVLQYPVKDNNDEMSNCAIACADYTGDPLKNELQFIKGSLINNISRKSREWCVGDHRGDRQKFFPTDRVRFLTKEEVTYIREVKQAQRDQDNTTTTHLIQHEEDNYEMLFQKCLNLRTDYSITFADDASLDIIATPTLTTPTTSSSNFERKTLRLSCTSCRDLEAWFHILEQNHCLPRRSSETTPKSVAMVTTGSVTKRKGRRKRGSCIIS